MSRPLLLAAPLLISALALAAPGPRPGPHGEGPHGPHGEPDPVERVARMTLHLDLDAVQRDAIEDLLAASLERTAPQRAELRETAEALAAERAKAAPGAKKVEQLVRRMASLQADLLLERMATKDAIFATLRPEQREKAQAHLDARREAGFHGRGHHGPGGPPDAPPPPPVDAL